MGNEQFTLISFIRDAAWGFAGTVGTFVSAWIAYRLSKASYKSLAFGARGGAVDHPEYPIHDLEIKGVESTQTMCVVNQGTLPIAPGDFGSPISIIFDGDAVVTGVKVFRATPSNLPVVATIHDLRTIQIEPLILNPTDTFVLEVTGVNLGETRCEARIVGVVSIATLARADSDPSLRISNFVTTMLTTWAFLSFAAHRSEDIPDWNVRIWFLSVATVVYGIGLAFIVGRRRRQARGFVREVSRFLLPRD